MGLRILHTADWHMDSPFSGFSPEQRAWLKQEQRKLPGKIVDLVRRENCDLVLISGDVFDSPDARESVPLVRQALADCAVPVFIAPGNHDYLSSTSPWLREVWPENVHIFAPGLTWVDLPGLDCRVFGAGYRGMESPALLENFRAAGEARYQLMVLHGDPQRAQSPYCPVTGAQVRASGLTYLALGHIHKSGSFSAGDTLCGWPGCPMGRGFDETGEKGVYLVDMDGTASIRFVSLDTPRFYDLEGNAGDLENILPPVESQDFFRLTVTGSGEHSLEDWKARLPHLEIIDRRQKQEDLWSRAGEDTLEGVYFRLLRQKLEQADPAGMESVLLAAEISRKILDGGEVAL